MADKVDPQGHWYVGATGTIIEENHKENCACGYQADSKEAIEGHIHWEVEKMKVVVAGVMAQQAAPQAEAKATGDTSDGYHTFNELYHYRALYNAGFFNELHFRESRRKPENRINPVKSKRHSDGELCFGGGWFVVSAKLSTGQITNHYEEKYWDLFKIPEADRAPIWDGHSPADAAQRLESFLRR